MGKGCNAAIKPGVKTYTWDEVKKHTSKDDKWLVIDGDIYDITEWSKKHPGGSRVISHYAGQDATDVWIALHNNKEFVTKFMKPLWLGRVEEGKQKGETRKQLLDKEFRDLRQKAVDNGWFKVDPVFFCAHFAHIIILDLLAWLTFYYLGTGWLPYLLATALLVASQAQAGWLQHDFGHHCVFNDNRTNHIVQDVIMGPIKGASSHWWNFRHFQHHAKPNVYKKDPDISVPLMFVLGSRISKQWGQKKRGFMPYQFQHEYFFLLMPLLMPVYFHIEIISFLIKKRSVKDFTIGMSFFARWIFMYGTFLGIGGAMALYMFVRAWESIWFTLSTQMSHIPMEIDADQDLDWLTMNTTGACNAYPNFLVDWFTGHLNYQIEHHLFPTMPRHNFCKVAPHVKELCKKHNLPYTEKPILTAFADIARALKKYGDVWYEAYHM